MEGRMATKKKTAKRKTAKRAAGGARRLATIDLSKVALASVTAALKKAPIKPGVLAGFIIDQDTLDTMNITADALAKNVATEISAKVGVRLRPGKIIGPRDILVGFMPPPILRV
jgi:hypothetical protein